MVEKEGNKKNEGQWGFGSWGRNERWWENKNKQKKIMDGKRPKRSERRQEKVNHNCTSIEGLMGISPFSPGSGMVVGSFLECCVVNNRGTGVKKKKKGETKQGRKKNTRELCLPCDQARGEGFKVALLRDSWG